MELAPTEMLDPHASNQPPQRPLYFKDEKEYRNTPRGLIDRSDFVKIGDRIVKDRNGHTSLALMDNIARGSGGQVSGIFADIKEALGITDQELSLIRPTAVASSTQMEWPWETGFLATLFTMATIKEKFIKITVSDCFDQVDIVRVLGKEFNHEP